MKNLNAVVELLDRLARAGVREFCVCAGSRNSPIVALLCQSTGFELFSFPDERAAAYFALGRVKLLGHPVGVVTTSGTAAAELLPAIVEAHYSGLPLVAITADRPRSYRGTGAPQSIEQKNLFGVYVEQCLDFEAGEAWNLDAWSGKRPLHLNIGFDEPLLDGALPEFAAPDAEARVCALTPALAHAEKIRAFWSKLERPLVVLGAVAPRSREAVQNFLATLQVPIYAEALSGLRESTKLEPWLLKSGDRILSQGNFDGVLRIGGVPTLRFWRDLEEKYRHLPVMHLTSLPFAGLSRGELLQGSLSQMLFSIRDLSPKPAGDLHELDRVRAAQFWEVVAAEPRSEMALVHAFSRVVPEKARVFLGNSLSIREWDLAAHRRARGIECAASRGANGIDGQVSTFFGQCDLAESNWALLGDLTALYDLSAPWVLDQLSEDLRFQLVILNNGGGRIFSRVRSLASVDAGVRRKFFENTHKLRFGDWARMWNLGYEEWTHVPAQGPASSQGVVELRPDAASSERFWTKFDKIWESAK